MLHSLAKGGAGIVLVPCVICSEAPESADDVVVARWLDDLHRAARIVHGYAIWANKIGWVEDLPAVGNSMVVDQHGSVLARGSRDEEEVVRTVISVERGRVAA